VRLLESFWLLHSTASAGEIRQALQKTWWKPMDQRGKTLSQRKRALDRL